MSIEGLFGGKKFVDLPRSWIAVLAWPSGQSTSSPPNQTIELLDRTSQQASWDQPLEVELSSREWRPVCSLVEIDDLDPHLGLES